MTSPLPVIDMPDPSTFVADYLAANQPVVVNGLDFDADQWTPETLLDRVGDLMALVYGDLFDLEDVQTVEEYIDDWFGLTDGDEEVPYIRWYNKLRDVDFAWGDEAFTRLAPTWRAPECLPTAGYLVPVSGSGTDPVTDRFPYRGVLIAARGARTRLHRDPFSSDAVVCQFHGVKEAALYQPSRADELLAGTDSSSFGGFVDVRDTPTSALDVAPDYHGFVEPGQMIYIPNGWLHDVIVTEDSLSVTWNFVHRKGAERYHRYLKGEPESDSEFEILQYFHQLSGLPAGLSSTEIEARVTAATGCDV